VDLVGEHTKANVKVLHISLLADAFGGAEKA
jgi:hypothetical protein